MTKFSVNTTMVLVVCWSRTDKNDFCLGNKHLFLIKKIRMFSFLLCFFVESLFSWIIALLYCYIGAVLLCGNVLYCVALFSYLVVAL